MVIIIMHSVCVRITTIPLVAAVMLVLLLLVLVLVVVVVVVVVLDPNPHFTTASA